MGLGDDSDAHAVGAANDLRAPGSHGQVPILLTLQLQEDCSAEHQWWAPCCFQTEIGFVANSVGDCGGYKENADKEARGPYPGNLIDMFKGNCPYSLVSWFVRSVLGPRCLQQEEANWRKPNPLHWAQGDENGPSISMMNSAATPLETMETHIVVGLVHERRELHRKLDPWLQQVVSTYTNCQRVAKQVQRHAT